MKFLVKEEDHEPVYSTDYFYDLFDGGYINPYYILEEKDAKKIEGAVELIQDFLNEAEERGFIEES